MAEIIKTEKGYKIDKIKIYQDIPEDLKALVTPANLRGIIPNPHNAERVHSQMSKGGAGATAFYTVAVDKILFIHAAQLAGKTATNTGSSWIRVYTSGDVLIYDIFYWYIATANGQLLDSASFCPALEVPALAYVTVGNTTSGMYSRGGIHGWLEDA